MTLGNTEKLILFSKTYSGDLEKFQILYDSIVKHNKESIPFYASVPAKELALFIPRFPECNFLFDEEIVPNGVKTKGWVGQQYVKAYLYKIKLSRYYVCIDSDSYFIRDFTEKDFLYDDDVPYMVMHDNVELFELTAHIGKGQLGFDPIESYVFDNKAIMAFFNRDGAIYDYGPTPCVWRSLTWELLDEEYGIQTLFTLNPCEIKWYGEAVLHFGLPYMPIGSLFKCIHYKFQYDIMKQVLPTEDYLRHLYLGVVMQSNWNAPLKY